MQRAGPGLVFLPSCLGEIYVSDNLFYLESLPQDTLNNENWRLELPHATQLTFDYKPEGPMS